MMQPFSGRYRRRMIYYGGPGIIQTVELLCSPKYHMFYDMPSNIMPELWCSNCYKPFEELDALEGLGHWGHVDADRGYRVTVDCYAPQLKLRNRR